MTAWWNWITRIREELRAIPDDPSLDLEARDFLHQYRSHTPFIIKLPDWPAFQWTLAELRQKAGYERVQVQVDRLTDPDYESRAGAHRGFMTFAEFLDRVEREDGNACYMTAQNSDKHRGLTAILSNDLRPMPSYLTDQPEHAYLWLGKDTVTPLHHDVTSNLMCQIMGRKNVRMVMPDYWHRVDHRQGVHTGIHWITDEIAATHGFQYLDFWLNPGEALCLPVGWWHCVKAHGVSITAVYTNYRWTQTAHLNFSPISR